MRDRKRPLRSPGGGLLGGLLFWMVDLTTHYANAKALTELLQKCQDLVLGEAS